MATITGLKRLKGDRLDVGGQSNLKTVSVSGVLSISGNTALANASISKAFSVSGSTALANVAVSGNTSLANIAVSGLTSTNTLSASGNTSLANVSISGSLTLPSLEDDLICTITPRTGGNMASIVNINSTGVYGYEFLSNSTKEISFTVQLSHQWEEGTSVTPHFHWCPSTTNTGNAIFHLDYWVANRGEVLPAATPLSVTTTPSGNAYQHQLASFGSVSMTGKTASCIFGGRLYRNPTETGDDFTGEAIVLGVDIHIVKNRWGYNS